jgi:glycosyltransferase involved in cell wall biosynthesis
MGAPGIQYINFPIFASAPKSVRALVAYPDSAVRRVLRRATARAAGFSHTAIQSNKTLAVSGWTARVVREVYGIDAEVVYPPVQANFPVVPWEERENGLLCVSRVVPEKTLERAVEIVERVRARGEDVHLRVIGGTQRGSDPKYLKRIRALQASRREWFILDQDLSRESLIALFGRYRYGLHVRENEQFGIGIAELVRAGCVTFVPCHGGQAEIVASIDDLTFSTNEEAATKITHVVRDSELQLQLREQLRVHGERFSSDSFIRSIREVVSRHSRSRSWRADIG